ncbi:MAG: hypothetical protein ACLQU3_33615 [Limisphaerales bacterium]
MSICVHLWFSLPVFTFYFLLSTFCFSSAAPASQYHVAPDGKDPAPGTLSKPLSLTQALSSRSPARPGDTIWLHRGTYPGPFTSALTGQTDKPIIVRQWPGERATIDCPATNSAALTIQGAWTWYWGFEVTCTSTNRGSTRCCGVDVFGPHTRCINLVVHDAGVGIGFWVPAIDAEIYGCLIYNNGWQGPGRDRGHGHAIYAQNAQGAKRIRDNILFNQFGWGVHIYTERGSIQGFDLEGNAAFNNGCLTRATNHYPNYLVGGFRPSDRITFIQNYAWQPPGTRGCDLELGYHATNGAVVVQSNYFAEGSVAVQWWTNVTFTDNTIAGLDAAVSLRSIPGVRDYLWDRNHYDEFPPHEPRFAGELPTIPPLPFRRGEGRGEGSDLEFRDKLRTLRPFDFNSTNLTFRQWQAASGYDLSSQHSTNPPPHPAIFILPNLYETNRANIIIFNWPRAATVPIDLGAVLPKGTAFELRNSQDFFGPPVLQGRYGGQPIHIPMTELKAEKAIGLPSPPPASWPDFNVFILLPVANASR